jgi:transcriptional regulator with PAS, ATPase and Fis domain
VEPRIGVISSSVKLCELAREVSRKLEVHLEIQFSTLEGAISSGKELEARGIEVIISRGGTAAILRNNLSIPVLAIPLSAFDLLENIREARKYGRKIGISAYGTPISNLKIFEQLFEAEIRQVIYNNSESLRVGILQARNEGIEVMVGGGYTSEISQQIGLPCIFIGSNAETIRSAVEEAKIVARIRREEKEKTKRIEAIIDSVSEGMVAIDRNKKITVFNKVAEDLLGVRDAIGMSVEAVAPKLGLCEVLKTGKPKYQSIQKLGGNQIIVNLMPLYLGGEIIGAIASFSNVSEVVGIEHKVRRSYAKGFVANYTLDNMVRESPVMRGVVEQVRQFAQSDSTVLITGETGTGKELIAHCIHNLSPRKKEPFVTINCSALPESLLESEIFGHEEGAFTGAKKGGKIGLFEMADRGSIFLDEIGSISKGFQARLLRVLQNKDVMRVGGDRVIPVDVRVIAATNKNLIEEVGRQQMRMDLYYRLNILRIHVPPLRERREDIPYLVRRFFDFFVQKYEKVLESLPEILMERFLDYTWPGNVRELQNLMERFVLMVGKPKDYEKVLNKLFEECLNVERILVGKINGDVHLAENGPSATLNGYVYNREDISKLLGISRTTLWRKLKNREK